MIDSSILNAYPATNGTAAASSRFHMKRDPDARMAGSVPVWENPKPPVDSPAHFDSVMNYADVEPAAGANISDSENEAFGFGDLIDIVNPLHHIPLVSAVYEGVTGDTIKPSGRIIGGAIFGGFAGAAAGIANVIVEEETGKSMSGNVVALVTQGTLPPLKRETLSPEEHLNQAAQLAFNDIEAQPLPAMALSLQAPAQTIQETVSPYENYRFNRGDDDRMAGTMMRRKSHDRNDSPLPRAMLADPVSINLAAIRADQTTVTQINLSPLPRE